MLLMLLLACRSVPAFAQVDLMGSWRPLPAEIDQATQKVIAYHGHLNMQEQEARRPTCGAAA